MKKNQIVNWVSFALATMNALFLFMEIQWPLAAFVITLLVFLSLVVSTILAFQANKENGLGKVTNYSITGILLILILSTVFRVLHWPTFRELQYAAIFILPLVLLFTNKQHKVSNSYWMTFLIYIMIVYLNISVNSQRTFQDLVDCERKLEQVQVSNDQQ